MNSSLHKFWWLWLPCSFMVFQVAAEWLLPTVILKAMHNESGPHELLQAAVAAAGLIAALRILTLPALRGRLWLMLWVGIAALGCFYIAGEEISWGQQFLKWATPESWIAVNDQGETNLHNTSSWLDQKPRLILLIGIFTGGLIIPLLRRYKKQWLPEKFDIIYPPSVLAVTALIILAIRILDVVDSSAKDIVIFTRSSEVEELYSFYFVLLYLVALRRRVLQ